MTNYDLFTGKSMEEVRLLEAKTLLERNGYKVIKTPDEAKEAAIEAGFRVSLPLFVDKSIKSFADLRNLFYKKLYAAYTDVAGYSFEGNYKIDMKYIRLLVESREKTGLNRENAIQEAAAIISIIFDYVDEFNFRQVPDIRILGQDKMAWVTDKALSLINKKLSDRVVEEVNTRIDDIENEIGNEISNDEVVTQLKSLLNGLKE